MGSIDDNVIAEGILTVSAHMHACFVDKYKSGRFKQGEDTELKKLMPA